MKAEIGRRYAQVINGRCYWKFDSTLLPEWKDDAFLAVDITDLPVEPNEGDDFDGVVFTKPAPPPPPTADEVEQDGRTQLAMRFNRALVVWLSQKHGQPVAQTVQELATIYRNLP